VIKRVQLVMIPITIARDTCVLHVYLQFGRLQELDEPKGVARLPGRTMPVGDAAMSAALQNLYNLSDTDSGSDADDGSSSTGDTHHHHDSAASSSDSSSSGSSDSASDHADGAGDSSDDSDADVPMDPTAAVQCLRAQLESGEWCFTENADSFMSAWSLVQQQPGFHAELRSQMELIRSPSATKRMTKPPASVFDSPMPTATVRTSSKKRRLHNDSASDSESSILKISSSRTIHEHEPAAAGVETRQDDATPSGSKLTAVSSNFEKETRCNQVLFSEPRAIVSWKGVYTGAISGAQGCDIVFRSSKCTANALYQLLYVLQNCDDLSPYSGMHDLVMFCTVTFAFCVISNLLSRKLMTFLNSTEYGSIQAFLVVCSL
jgi:hypothetical protein